MADFIGYTVKFPGAEDDTSMTMALKKMSIKTPRIQSTKRRENHFYAPYTPSKRRAISDSTKSAFVSMEQSGTVPLRPVPAADHQSCHKLENPAESTIPISEPELKPWGILISKTVGKPNIPLLRASTGLGKVCQVVDIHTGERLRQYSISLSRFSC